MGTPFFILATGQSNIYANGAGVPFTWSPSSRAKVWNNVRDSDTSVGTAYNALSPSLVDITLRYASNVAAADPNKDVYLANYSRGGQDILHWTGGMLLNYPGVGAGNMALNAVPEAATVMTMSTRDIYNVIRYYEVANVVPGEKLFIKQGVRVYQYTVTAPVSWDSNQATFQIAYVSGSGGLTAGGVQVEFQPRFLTMIENSVPAALAAAGKSTIDVLLWWQGESDSEYNTRYEPEFEFVISYLSGKPWWSSSTKIIICAMNSTANNGRPEADQFNARLAALAAANPTQRKFANIAANVPANRWADVYHMYAQGYADAGDYLLSGVYAPALVDPGGGGGDPIGGTGTITGISVGALTSVMDVRTNGNHGALSDGNAYGLWLDGSPHPYRDAAGNKYIVLPHSENYRFLVGNWSDGGSWTLQGTTLEGARNISEGAYNNRNWVFGLWSEGSTVYSLIHHEWYVNNRTSDGIPGFNGLNIPWNASTFNRQWVNAISWARSTDGGRNFATSAASNSTRLVLVPEPWGVQQKQHLYGYFHPSNIVKEGAYFYAAVEQRSLNATGTAANSGVSLIRTTNLSSPTGWQFWDGSTWVTVNHNTYQGNLSSQVPHRFFETLNHDYYASAAYNSHMGQCLRYHLPSSQWLMFGYAGTLGSKLGYSVSATLANPQFTTINPVTVPNAQDFDSSAGRYISVFDEAATDNNYVNIGNNCTVLVTNGASSNPDFKYSYAQILRGAVSITVSGSSGGQPVLKFRNAADNGWIIATAANTKVRNAANTAWIAASPTNFKIRNAANTAWLAPITGSAPPTYSIAPSTTNANEGTTVVYTVTTTNVANGTILYWTNYYPGAGYTGWADFTDGELAGGITITGNVGSFSRALAADQIADGIKTMVMQLRTGSSSGPIVATATPVTVNDTSVPAPPQGPPNPYTLNLVHNDLDFIYAADVANTGGTFVQLDFVIAFDDFYTAGAHHIAIGVNVKVTNPHSFHCGPIIRNGKLLWSYGRGFFITAGNDGVYAEHWNGTPSPAFELVPRTGGSGFNPAANPKVRVRVIGGLRTGIWANQMLIYIRDFNTNALLFHGSRAWGWDSEANYTAVIAGIGMQFQQPADNGCVERSGPGANPNSSATITDVVHQVL